MSRETIKKNLPFIQAFAEGKDVQYRYAAPGRFGREWLSINDGSGIFADPNFEFRIKPEPREFWINVYSGPPCDLMIHSTKKRADEEASDDRLECIHVREVVDEG